MLSVVVLAAFGCTGDDDDDGGGASEPSKVPARMTDRGDFVTAWEPSETQLQEGLMDALRDTQLFEQLAEALNDGLKLPKDLPIVHLACGEENAAYDPAQGAVLMCYELLEKIGTLAAQDGAPDEEVGNRVIATWLFVFFHELGHGLIDLYDLPITGREEDAVDDFSTVLLIEAGASEFAIRAAEFWALTDPGMYDELSYADEHSLNSQRFFSILCTVYGSDPDTYESIVTEGYLPVERAQRCPGEYMQKLNSWTKLLEPWAK